MRKIICLAVTFISCLVLNTGSLWLWFTPIFLAMLAFDVPESAWWEIPLAVLFCSVINIGFKDNITTIMRVMIVLSSALIAYQNPGRLAVFFLVAIAAIYFDNIYAFASVWAMQWCAVRAFFVQRIPLSEGYSTTK